MYKSYLCVCIWFLNVLEIHVIFQNNELFKSFAQQTKKVNVSGSFYNLKHTNQKGFSSFTESLKSVHSTKNLILPLLTTATYVQWLILMPTNFFQMLLGLLKIFKALMFRIFWEFRNEKGYSFHSCLYTLEKREKKKGKEKFKV